MTNIKLVPGKLYKLKDNNKYFYLFGYSLDKSRPTNIIKSIRLDGADVIMFLSAKIKFGATATKWLYNATEMESTTWGDDFADRIQYLLEEVY